MKKIFVVIFIAAMMILATGTAMATPDTTTDSSGNNTFWYEPSTYAPEWQGPNPYGRNIYWNFSTNPTLGTDAEYFGDDLSLRPGTSVAFGGSTHYDSTGTWIGLKDKSKTGTATFTINNYPGNLNYDQYAWVEFNYTTNHGGALAYSLSAPDGTIIGGPTTYDRTGGLFDVWYKIKPFPTSMILTFNFSTTGEGGSNVHLGDVHFASTPEPVSTALFLLGGTVLVARRLRKKAHKA